MNIVHSVKKGIKHCKLYWTLGKFWQTGLLSITGIAGYFSAIDIINYMELAGLIGTLILTIAGSTILNMAYDRDIDANMNRTKNRPLPSNKVQIFEAVVIGLVFSVGGILWAYTMNHLYALMLLSGSFINVVIYTIWLKRRTAWSIIWGGVAGGMPILAGRVLALGYIDIIGVLLAVAILLWIPSHIMTFSICYYEDYNQGKIPTFPSSYGFSFTRAIIAVTSFCAVFAIGIGAAVLGLSLEFIVLLGILSLGILGVSIVSVAYPSDKINLFLFKYASVYMLGSMLLIIINFVQ